MTKHLVVFALVYSVANQEALSQEIIPIITDRPDQTESPFTLPKKHFQMETGFSFEKTNSHTSNYLLPSILFKYGITGSFDLRLITEFTSVKDEENNISGLNPLTVGFKVNIAQEKGILPTTSFIGHLTLPFSTTNDLKTTYYAPAFRFTMQHTLSERVNLGYNLGAEWNGETAEPTFIYTITTGCALGEKTGAYAELYGFIPQKSAADHLFDGGLTYLLKQNIQFDISGGFGLTPAAPDYFIALGFSFRLKD